MTPVMREGQLGGGSESEIERRGERRERNPLRVEGEAAPRVPGCAARAEQREADVSRTPDPRLLTLSRCLPPSLPLSGSRPSVQRLCKVARWLLLDCMHTPTPGVCVCV